MARTRIPLDQVSGEGSAAELNVGTSANNVVQLNSSAQLPAVSGELLTNLTKTQVGLGNVENVTLSTWTGSAYLTTVGTIDTGTWEGSVVGITYGGTGAADASGARSALGLEIGVDVPAVSVVPKVLFDHFADVGTTNTDGTEDELYSDTVVANQLSANGQKLLEVEHLTLVGSATADRRVKKSFAGTVIYDTGTLSGLTTTAELTLTTLIIRVSSSTVRCVVSAATTSAVSLPAVVRTDVGSLDLVADTSVLNTSAIADNTGAASSDIVNTMATIQWLPAA
ncbi:MAG: hypothetical protein EBU46_00365 [Nitrosomonadaceae bacterium]|nr:hypothetical protein [Nitrosomonadaceae bacterium]